MAVKVVMPQLGLTMKAGTIGVWCVAEGDKVEKGDVLFEVETEKLSQEIESDDAGTVLKLLYEEGEEVPCGEPILILGDAGEDISAV